MVPRLGVAELLIILFVVLLIFGAGRLPALGRALGQGVRALRRSMDGSAETRGRGKRRR